MAQVQNFTSHPVLVTSDKLENYFVLWFPPLTIDSKKKKSAHLVKYSDIDGVFRILSVTRYVLIAVSYHHYYH